MSTQIQWRKGTTAEHSTFTGATAEVTVDMTKDTLVVHDGTTVGGFPLAHEDGNASQIFKVAAPTASTHSTNAGTIQTQGVTRFTTGGTSTAFTLTPVPAIIANTAGTRLRVAFNAAAGATPTLAVSGLTALNLKYKDSTGAKQAVTATQIPSGWSSDVECDGTDWVVLDIPPVTVTPEVYPKFSVYLSPTDQSLPNATPTKIAFNNEEYDTNNNFDSSTNFRFTPTVAGKYHFSACWSITDTDGAANIVVFLYKNGVAAKLAKAWAPTDTTGGVQISCDLDANGSTDYFEVYARQDGGGTETIAAGQSSCFFMGHRLP
jgi:hypothetical protein